ncbi:MAG: MarC family protein [Alsobacter sp.]
MLDYLASALVTLLVTVDPPGLAPIFLGITPGMDESARRQVATRAVIIAGLIMAASGFVGAQLLEALGITLPAFRIAGGLLLFWISFEMVFARRTERKTEHADMAITIDHIRNVAAFPLAIPLMAGPGAITACILLAGRAEGDLPKLAVLMLVIVGVMLSCFAVFLAATRISKWLGVTGNVVLTRLLGVILSALAVQFVVDGVKAAFH